ELLTHAGSISHQMALERSGQEYSKYQLEYRKMEKEQSLKEIEDDIKRLENKGISSNLEN
ncbi:MAG: cell filamentation protein Fic, partial [Bacteroidales bacterium]|nr:cell filamentation protein Fic [Bacteroidales bacterium]